MQKLHESANFRTRHGHTRHGRTRSARRGGSTIVLMALSMTVLMGCAALAVDYGLLVADASRMQRAADAAALAGASELCTTGTDATAIYNDTARARALAVVVAQRNGATVNANDITFPQWNRINVPASTTRNFFFATMMGQRSSAVTRTAMAGRMPLKGVSGVVPIAITTNDYNTYIGGGTFEVQLIRNQDTNFDPGTATSLDLRLDNSGKSGAVFENDLEYGYSGQTVIGQQINSALTSDINSQGAKLEDAFDWRIDQAALAPYNDTGNNYTFPNYPGGDPRIITLIVADPNPANNNNPQVTARRFVSVYIETVRSPANKAVYFRIRILPTRTYSSQDPNVLLGDDSGSFTGPSADA